MKQYTRVPWKWKTKTGQFQIKFRRNGLNYWQIEFKNRYRGRNHG